MELRQRWHTKGKLEVEKKIAPVDDHPAEGFGNLHPLPGHVRSSDWRGEFRWLALRCVGIVGLYPEARVLEVNQCRRR